MGHSTDTRTPDDCDRRLDEELAETFPASDPPSLSQPRTNECGDPAVGRTAIAEADRTWSRRLRAAFERWACRLRGRA
jgi:hypothetical protein